MYLAGQPYLYLLNLPNVSWPNNNKSVKSLKQLNKSTGSTGQQSTDSGELLVTVCAPLQHGDLFDRDQTVAHTTPEIRAEQLPSAAPTCSSKRDPASSSAPAPAPAPRPSSVATLCATLYTATRLSLARCWCSRRLVASGRQFHARQNVRQAKSSRSRSRTEGMTGRWTDGDADRQTDAL